MIKILIVDDSPTEIAILKTIFSQESDLEVVGCARNGREAIELNKKLNPDLITMDLNMPVMDGVNAIKEILFTKPVPIVVISSSLDDTLLNNTFRALDAGALSVLDKPHMMGHPSADASYKRIIDTVRNMAHIHVIKRITPPKSKIKKIMPPSDFKRPYEIIAIATSVGGPQALKNIFLQLPAEFPVPIVVVQHMTPGFIDGFTKYLTNNCPLRVKLAEEGESLNPGIIYFAPDKVHLKVARINEKLYARLVSEPPISGFCPSGTVLLQSVAQSCGKNAIGVLLTGMGNDGAEGLLALKKAKGHTIIQDAKSTVVFGMAGVAQSLGAVDRILDLNKIPLYLQTILERKIEKIR